MKEKFMPFIILCLLIRLRIKLFYYPSLIPLTVLSARVLKIVNVKNFFDEKVGLWKVSFAWCLSKSETGCEWVKSVFRCLFNVVRFKALNGGCEWVGGMSKGESQKANRSAE